MSRWYSPRWTKWIRMAIDTWLPIALRDQRWLYVPIIRWWNPGMDPDFKVKALRMSEYELQEAYAKLQPKRNADMTPRTSTWVLEHLTGQDILEVGCGNGAIAEACAKRGFRVTATDFSPATIAKLRTQPRREALEVVQANVEDLPFPDKHFDTSLCLHTLEHVVHLDRAIAELLRVTRKRLLIIVPKQRYFRYTADYHLHFFASKEQLALALGINSFHIEEIDHCLCYIGEVSQSHSE